MRAGDRSFDLNAFFELYAALGAQRATKVLGIFARLDRRDGKPQYLRRHSRGYGATCAGRWRNRCSRR